MANDFSSDSSCKALWRFESGYLTVDSKSTNTLTQSNVQSDTSNFREGSGSADFEKDNSPLCYRTDSNLSAGFPLKYGDTAKTGTFAFWLRPETAVSQGFICGKYDADNSKRSIGVCLNTLSKIRVYWGYNSGANGDYYDTTLTLTNGRWYHVTVSFDGVNKKLLIVIWDDYNQAIHSWFFYPGYELYVSDAEFTIGYKPGATPDYYDGQLDELVVFNTPKSIYEANQLRAGTYTGAAGLLVTSAGLNVEYRQTPQQTVTQLIAQVLYTPPDPNTFIYYGNIVASVDPSATSNIEWSKTGGVTTEIGLNSTYFYNPPGHFEFRSDGVPVTVAPSATHINCPNYNGAIDVAITPSADVWVQTRAYQAEIGLAITPSCMIKLPVIGRDDETGYGIVDIAFLSETPPYWSIEGDIPMDLDPTAAAFVFYAEKNIIASGGLAVGGVGEYRFVDPGQTDIVADGSPLVLGGGTTEYGQPVYEFISPAVPRTDSIVGSGGLTISAPLFPDRQSFFVPISSLGNTVSVVGAGGIVFGGGGVFEVTGDSADDNIFRVVGSGGFVIGGSFLPVVRFIDPEDLIDEVVADALPLRLGGEAVVRFIDPPVDDPSRYPDLRPTYDGILRVGGEGVVAWVQPLVIAKEGAGGLIIGGGAETTIQAHTWVMTGSGLEASFYTGYDFNSYAVKDGKSYAAGPDGIYLIGGDTDAGRKIVSGLRLGPTNFMLKNRKYVRSMVLGECGVDTKVRFFAGDKEVVSDVTGGRANGSREVYAESIGIDVSGFEVLETVDITAVVAAHKR